MRLAQQPVQTGGFHDLHAVRPVQVAEIVRRLGRGDTLQDARRHFQHGHVQPQFGGDGGRLQPDIAAADDDKTAARCKIGLHRIDIGHSADGVDARKVAPDSRGQAAGDRSGGQDQFVIVGGFIAQRNGAGGGVDRGDGVAKPQGDVVFGIEFGAAQPKTLRLHLSHQIGFGQGRALIGGLGLGADQGDLPGVAAVTQSGDHSCPGLSCADYHHMCHASALWSNLRKEPISGLERITTPEDG